MGIFWNCSASILAVVVLLTALLQGHLRDAGLTRMVDRLHPKLPGTFPFLYADPWGFEFKDIPDLTGQIAVVTGANTGLGFFTALHLAINGAKVMLACRSEQKCIAASEAISSNLTAGRGSVVPMSLDLSSLASVKQFADDLIDNYSDEGIDQLVFNAGFIAPTFTVTKDGIEHSWQVNHVGHHYLFQLLEPLIVTAADKHGKATVTAVASAAHFEARSLPLSVTEVNCGKELFNSFHRYSQTKLANVLFAAEAQRRVGVKNPNVYINSVHPGMVNSEFARPDYIYQIMGEQLGSWVHSVVQAAMETMGWDSETASLTQLYTSTSPQIAARGIKGKYFHPIAQMNSESALVTVEGARRLWDFTNDLIKDRFRHL